ncbi:carboxypeptidase-like regulatory domain-containing protein [Flavobacterium sp. RHBU_24]|uniref:TonB-dependent receptor n=1 Tax=Flavobacterium sp. RHBU_24 TaxID=3391185 RepID=UPI0039848C6C
MKSTFTLLVFLVAFTMHAQTTLSGTITDHTGKPAAAANVYIDGTYDGAITAEDGTFSFSTDVTGSQVLVITALGFDDVKEPIIIEAYVPKQFKLQENVNLMDGVVISAGAFSAGDNTKINALKPLDIVTTAGSVGNIVAALQTLPGTQTVGESGRLFVRGGEADETQTFVDGLRVAQPYGATANNLPTRGRFSPFLFKGMTFSTGGYSAEFGEALSSVLLLNTIDEEDQEKTEISLMTVGLGLANTQKWGKSSLTVNTSYVNLQPYQWLIPQDVSWNKPYQSLSGESVYRYKFNNGLFKFYAAFDHADFSINAKDINLPEPVRTAITNDNFYANSSYKGSFGAQYTLQTGVAYGYSRNNIGLDQNSVDNAEHSAHLKVKLTKTFSNMIKLSAGAEHFTTDFNEEYKEPEGLSFNSGYYNNITAAYTEADFVFSKSFALKAGVRATYSSLLTKGNIDPRVALAYKAGKKGQFSLAYGDFHQTPRADYLKYFKDFEFEKTAHYIFNYMYNSAGKTFRAEAYYKDYANLVKYDTPAPVYNSAYNNDGNGFARGIDLFYRDSRSIGNLDYWISYSYIDSRRDYKNYEAKVTPSYIAKHNFSIVTKYWINSMRSQLGVTYSYNSGRPYDNPNESAFMAGRTKSYNNLSVSWAYLLSQQKILFFSVSNVLGYDNVFGYTYATTAGNDGQFARQAITQPASRFFFVGFFWTISDDKKANNLDNL